MENHPIPQDITGFQFKLIGKMTIRQFIYFAVGAVIAWLVFFIIEPPTIIKWPISLISVGIGAAIAFIPIDGRPMDTMLRNLFGALTSPTKFIYQKEEVKIATKPFVSTSFPSAKPYSSPTPIQQPDPSEAISIVSQPVPVQAPQEPIPAVINDSSPPPPKSEKEDKPKTVTPPIVEEKKAEETPPPTPVEETSANDSNDLEKMLAESQRQKEILEKQILDMQAKQESNSKQKVTPIIAKPKTTERVRKIPGSMASSIGIPDIPDAPNLVTGIVKDSRGNPIQNIIIEVKDEDSNPVRAFKTNSFGKFASATSLSNGKYALAFEDPGEKHRFDEVALELVGSNVMPLEIISIDSREELRRELFN